MLARKQGKEIGEENESWSSRSEESTYNSFASLQATTGVYHVSKAQKDEGIRQNSQGSNVHQAAYAGQGASLDPPALSQIEEISNHGQYDPRQGRRENLGGDRHALENIQTASFDRADFI